jgi:hypothetical protein
LDQETLKKLVLLELKLMKIWLLFLKDHAFLTVITTLVVKVSIA